MGGGVGMLIVLCLFYFFLGDAREDWTVSRAGARHCGKTWTVFLFLFFHFHIFCHPNNKKKDLPAAENHEFQIRSDYNDALQNLSNLKRQARDDMENARLQVFFS